MREPGFYWIKEGAQPTEVAFWSGVEWRSTDLFGWRPSLQSTKVLSERLAPPEERL